MKNRTQAIYCVLLVLLIGFLAFRLFRSTDRGTYRAALSERGEAAKLLAEHLAFEFPGAQVAIISNPFSKERGQSAEISDFEDAGIQGVLQGFNGKGEVSVVFPTLRPGAETDPQSVYVDPKTTTPLSFLIAPDAFDRIVASHPDVDVLVSLIGIPVNIRSSAIWKSRDAPKLGFLLPDLRMLGSQKAIISAFTTEKIAAVVLKRPNAKVRSNQGSRENATGSSDAFLLVTKENIAQVLAAYPQVLPR